MKTLIGAILGASLLLANGGFSTSHEANEFAAKAADAKKHHKNKDHHMKKDHMNKACPCKCPKGAKCKCPKNCPKK